MNIFPLDIDPEVAARQLCDIHISKMVLESAQLLCTAASNLGVVGTPYDPTHPNHKCTRWVQASRANWEWMVAHSRAMHSEYMARRDRGHASFPAIAWCSRLTPPDDVFVLEGLTTFADAVWPASQSPWRSPLEGVDEYREYYIRKEKVWIKTAMLHALMNVAAGRHLSKGNKPTMEWSEPGSRPEWMGLKPDWVPSASMMADATEYGEGQALDHRAVTEEQWAHLESLVSRAA